MKKTNRILFVLLAILLVFSLLSLAACQPPPEESPNGDEDTPPTITDTAIVKNGYFANASNSDNSAAYVKDSVTNWTPASGATSYSSVKVGAIDLTQAEFEENKGVLSETLAYPGISPNTPKNEDGSYSDTNALVIANTSEAGSLYYKSAAITLGKGKHYKLSMDVYTKLLDIDSTKPQGVWIYINTGAYAEFQAIDTKEDWKTYTLYIEANNAADRTMYIQLWLGYGPKFIGSSNGTPNPRTPNPRMTKGVALFDNIVMTSIDKEAYDDAFEANSQNGREVSVVSNTTDNDTAIISLIYPDSNFSYVSDFATTSSASYKAYFSAKKGVPNTNDYTGQVGKDKIEDTSDFPTSQYGYSYSTVGIFDMSRFFAPTYNEDEGKTFKEYIDTYKVINSSFTAPKIDADYEFDAFMDPATREYRLAGRPDEPVDSTALMIFHPDYAVSGYGYKSKNNLLVEQGKYYTISVWVYVWVPEYGKTEVTTPTAPETARPEEADKPNRDNFESDEAYNAAKKAYDDNVKAWEDYDKKLEAYNDYIEALTDYNKARDRAKATFKLTGATIEGGEMLQTSDPTQQGVWQQLTFKIKGNELSDRSVALEYWYGEGNWGEDTLMAGGCLFDNVTIQVDATPIGEYKTLSPLTVEDYTQFDLLGEAGDNFIFAPFERDATDKDWEYSFEDKKTSSDAGKAGIISGVAAKNSTYWADGEQSEGYFAGYTQPGTFDVTVDNTQRLFDLVMLRNDIYTSSILKYKPKTLDPATEGQDREKKLPDLTVYPNAFYRLSMWVYTEGIDETLGLSVALLKDDDTSLSSLTKINTMGKWSEIVFYLQGSSDDFAEMHIKFTLGTGDNYTPANLIKGVAYATAITYKSIAYSEYNGATTGTLTAKYEVPSSTSAQDTVTNGWFNNLDSTTYSGDKKDVFDDEGNLIGIGIPESWTAKAAESTLDKPTGVKIEGDVISWTKGDKDQLYLIYMDGVKVETEANSDKKRTVENYYVGNTTSNTWAIKEDTHFAQKGATFKIRAVRNVDTANEKILGFSDFAQAGSYNGENNGDYSETNVGLHLPKSGVIDYKHYADGDFTKDSAFYTENHDNPYSQANPDGNLYYVSPYDKLLMVSSEYDTKLGYLSPSTGSLTSNAYYALSVWVKTVGDAKASITISNKSKVISINAPGGAGDLDYIGYVDQNTGGKWVQYTFYIKTTKMTSPAGLQLELYLGNPYAKPLKDGTKSYLQGTSKGTVFFDDVYYKKLDSEAQYNEFVYGDADAANKSDDFEPNTPAALNRLKDINGNLFANTYLYQLVDLTTDSFDNFTAGSSPLGGTPGSYSHYNVDGATQYSASDDLAAMLYGVYDKRTVMDEVSETILASGSKTATLFADDAEALKAFLTQDVGTGNNYLLLANIIDNGQYYLTGDSFSLNADSYYTISFWAKLKASAGKKAEFRFEYGNETDKWSTIYIASEEWTQYTFYVYNSDTNSVGGNQFAFYLGSNDESEEGANTADMFAGLLVIDNVTFAPLSTADEYNDAVTDFDALSAEDKASATFAYHKFVKAETEEEPPTDDEPPADGEGKRVNSQLWLLISSIIIGALLIAVVVVLSWRKISKRIKRNIPVKVISNVPVNMQTKEQRKTTSSKKDNISTDDFTD